MVSSAGFLNRTPQVRLLPGRPCLVTRLGRGSAVYGVRRVRSPYEALKDVESWRPAGLQNRLEEVRFLHVLRGDSSTGRTLPSHGRDRGSSPRRSTILVVSTFRRCRDRGSSPRHSTTFVASTFRRCKVRGRSSKGEPPPCKRSMRVRVPPIPPASHHCHSGPGGGAPRWYRGDGGFDSRGWLRQHQ
jgi:hypothetical protein